MLVVEHLLVGDFLPSVSGHAAHVRDHACLDAARHFVVRHVADDRVDEVLPLELVGIRFRLRVGPDCAVAIERVILAGPRLAGVMARSADDCCALGAEHDARHVVAAADDGASVEEVRRAVVEGVLDRVGVEVLVDEVLAVVTAAERLSLHRPLILHPADFVDLVDVEIAEQPAARPQEAVEVLDLEFELILSFGLPLREASRHGPVHPVSSHADEVADLAVLNSLVELLPTAAVANHQTDGALQILLIGLLGQFEHLLARRAVGHHRLFHEDVQALVDGVLVMNPAECQRRREDRDVARLQRVHRILVGVEADEDPLLGDVDQFRLRGEVLLERTQAGVGPLLENVSDRHQLDRIA